ncbi:unnamed protein product, partial [Lota lota]
MMELLRGIKEHCGIVLACRFKAKNTYEITMKEGRGKKLLLDGFKLKNARVMAKEARSNEMVKVCRLCIQPGHILRECPDFTCHKCKRQGHYARECDSQEGRRRGEEQKTVNEPASGSEDMFGSEEEQRQQDEDSDYENATIQERDDRVANRGQAIPPTIGSSMDGVSWGMGCSTRGMPEESAVAHTAESIPVTAMGDTRPEVMEMRSGAESRDRGAAPTFRNEEEGTLNDGGEGRSMEVRAEETSEEGESEDDEAVGSTEAAASIPVSVRVAIPLGGDRDGGNVGSHHGEGEMDSFQSSVSEPDP